MTLTLISQPPLAVDSMSRKCSSADSGERTRVAAALNRWLITTLAVQCRDGGNADGGFADNGTGWYDGRHSAYTLAQLIATRTWSDHMSVGTEQLDDAIRRGVEFICRRQHPDGRLDLCGMYSANEVGFTLPGLAAAYSHLAQYPSLADLQPDLKTFLLQGAEAVLRGDAHTANHRWTAAAAPLAAVCRLWHDPRYEAKIESYLSDGIDCDADGCWHFERSPNYNTVANEGLLILADCLGRKDLLDHVIRNLEFILHCLHPNGEMDASFSHRQDRGAANCPPAGYRVARRIAQITGDGRFTTLANMAWQAARHQPFSFIPLPFELDAFQEAMPAATNLPVSYEKIYKGVSIIRKRAGDRSLTLAADSDRHFFNIVRDQWGGPKHSDDWFHFHYGDLVIQSIHLAGAAMSNLQPAILTRSGDGLYRLQGVTAGWTHLLHFRPGSPCTKVIWDWKHQVDVHWTPAGIHIRLQSETPHALIAALRIWVRAGVTIEHGGNAEVLAAGREYWIEGPIALRSLTHRLRIDGLPGSVHQAPIRHAQPIPSVIESHCACLAIGLRFPVSLDFKLLYDAA